MEYTIKKEKYRTEYFLDGKRHREDGPAIEYANGDKTWWENDHLHREDGPAMELVSGDNFWYINGTEISEERFKELYLNDT